MIKGFTLLEILVTILIFSFIVGGMYGVLNVSRTNYDANSVSLNLQRQARQGMSWLVRDLRAAKASSTNIVQDGSNNNITFNTSSETDVKYYVNATTSQLKRISSTSAEVVKANDITGLVFPARGSSNIQQIQLNASKTFFSNGQNRTLTLPFTEQVQMRNL
jgi:prepilin-type N-terminal cleavage/methylation domain-containing protein